MTRKPKPKDSVGDEIHGVDLKAVKHVLDFMQEHGLEEFEYERKGVRIRLRKTSSHPRGASGQTPSPADASALAATAGIGAVAETSGAREPEPAETGLPPDVHVIKSPIVGTFFAAPNPDAVPFVALGDHVETGQVLCIIEAMKLMNEIESDIAGEVVRIFPENGHPVEYGEPLFGIRLKQRKK